MKTIKDLHDEYQAILLTLAILDRVAEEIQTQKKLNTADMSKLLEILTVFADKCHHGKEENVVLPALSLQSKSIVDIIIMDHNKGRGYIANIKSGLAQYLEGNNDSLDLIENNITLYTDLLKKHIAFEEDQLFVSMNKYLENQDAKMHEEFEKIESDVVGAGKHEYFHHILHDLSQAYQVHAH